MDVSILARQFSRVGARVKLGPQGGRRGFNMRGTVAINIDRDRDGEFFEFQGTPGSNVSARISLGFRYQYHDPTAGWEYMTVLR